MAKSPSLKAARRSRLWPAKTLYTVFIFLPLVLPLIARPRAPAVIQQSMSNRNRRRRATRLYLLPVPIPGILRRDPLLLVVRSRKQERSGSRPNGKEENMDVFEAVRTVLAVRRYQDRPVPDDVLHRIVEAGQLTA